MKKRFLQFFIVLSLVIGCTGCTSVSLKMSPETAPQLAKQEVPVKFNFDTITWKTYSTVLPPWFAGTNLQTFITKIKLRAPELFSNDAKALPLTFHIEHTRKSNSGGLIFLSFLTGFTIIPAIIDNDHAFTVEVRIGNPVQHTERYSFTISQREFFSMIPFYALFMPAQDDHFCHELISISGEAINSYALQNVFLNMIYKLDKDKLRRLYDDKFGEEVQLLGAEE